MVAIEETVFRRSGEGIGGSGGEVTVSLGVLEFRDNHANGLVSFRVGGGGGGRESLPAVCGGEGIGGSGPCNPCKTLIALEGTGGPPLAVMTLMVSLHFKSAMEAYNFTLWPLIWGIGFVVVVLKIHVVQGCCRNTTFSQ